MSDRLCDNEAEVTQRQENPFALSLSKRCPFWATGEKKMQGFDRLSPNGPGDDRGSLSSKLIHGLLRWPARLHGAGG